MIRATQICWLLLLVALLGRVVCGQVAFTTDPEQLAERFQFRAQLDDSYKMFWSINASTTPNESMMHFALQGQVAGWMGIGFADASPSNGMVGSRAIICSASGSTGTATEYTLSSRDPSAFTTHSSILQNVQGLQEEVSGTTVSTVFFSRPVTAAGFSVYDESLLPDASTTSLPTKIIWAYHSTSDSLAKHTTRSKAEIDLLASDSLENSNSRTLQTVHGGMMFAVFGFLLVIGALFPAFGREKYKQDDAWFRIHIICQNFAIFLFICAIIIGFVSVDEHYSALAHSILGTIILVFVVLIAVFAYTRPAKTHPRRKNWYLGHRTFAWIIIVLGNINIILGLNQIDASKTLIVVFAVYFGLLIATVSYQYFKKAQNRAST